MTDVTIYLREKNGFNSKNSRSFKFFYCAVISDTPLVLFREPVWNETFTTDLFRNAENVGFTVFHDATMPPGSNTNLVLFP